MHVRAPETKLTPALFNVLSTLVEERTGIHYDERENEIFTSKVLSRASEAGFTSALDYYYFLRYDDAGRSEFDSLIDTLVVGETYFFREAAALAKLCDAVVRPLVDTGRRVRVWCAASSTGEEPLTLAMLLEERGLLSSVDIVASDISPRSLARAREGVFRGRSLRVVDDELRARWFTGPREAPVAPRRLVEAIDWRRVNLTNVEAVEALGKFDVVICRNVLIYFREETVQRVAGSLASALKPGGLLLVGASESLLRFGTMLVCEERGGFFFYRCAA